MELGLAAAARLATLQAERARSASVVSGTESSFSDSSEPAGYEGNIWLANYFHRAYYYYIASYIIIYRTRRNFRGGLIFVLFAGEVDPRKLMRTKIKNYGPSP